MAGDRMTVRTGAALVLVSALAVYVLHEGASLFAPLFVSVLLAYAIEPLVALLMRARLSRFTAAALTYLIFAMLTGSLGRTAARHVDAFLSDLPNVTGSVRQLRPSAASGLSSPLGRLRTAAAELAGTGEVGAPSTPPDVVRVAPVAHRFDLRRYVRRWSMSAAEASGRTLLIALLTFLLVCTGDISKRKLIQLGGPRLEERRLTVEVIRAIDRQIERYLVARMLISAIVAGATGLGLWLTGVSHPFAWGAVAGVLNVLPFIGPTLAVALIAGAAFLQFKTAGPTLGAGAIAASVAMLEGNILTPALTSRAGDVNTVAVFVSVLFFGWLWGVWGLVLAVPMTVAIKAAADHVEPLQPVGELLGR